MEGEATVPIRTVFAAHEETGAHGDRVVIARFWDDRPVAHKARWSQHQGRYTAACFTFGRYRIIPTKHAVHFTRPCYKCWPETNPRRT